MTKAHHYPSPLLGLGHVLAIQKDQLAFYQRLHAHDQDAVCITLGPYQHWVLFHPDLIKDALVKHADKLVRFKPVLKILSQWNGTSVLIAEGQPWKAQRRTILPGLKSQNLAHYAQQIACLTATGFRDLALDDAFTFEADAHMAKLTLCIAAQTLFGVDLQDQAADIVRAVSTLSDVAFSESTSILPMPDWLPTTAKQDKKAAMRRMAHTVETIINNANRSDDGPPNVLSQLAQKYQGDKQLIRNEVMTLLIAGHETTGAAMSWIFYLLARHTDICQTLHQHLCEKLGDRTIAYHDLKQLDLLQAVIKEALRLFPPAYTLFVRQAREAITVGGLNIKKGHLLQVVPYVTQRDARWFAQPNTFDPERFLRDKDIPPYAYIPFGVGPRICIGQSFSMMELMVMTATILREYHPQAMTDQVAPEAKSSLRPKGGLPLCWRKV